MFALLEMNLGAQSLPDILYHLVMPRVRMMTAVLGAVSMQELTAVDLITSLLLRFLVCFYFLAV